MGLSELIIEEGGTNMRDFVKERPALAAKYAGCGCMIIDKDEHHAATVTHDPHEPGFARLRSLDMRYDISYSWHAIEANMVDNGGIFRPFV